MIAIDFLSGGKILRIEQFVDSDSENCTQTAAVDLFFHFFSLFKKLLILNRISKLCKHDQGGP